VKEKVMLFNILENNTQVTTMFAVSADENELKCKKKSKQKFVYKHSTYHYA